MSASEHVFVVVVLTALTALTEFNKCLILHMFFLWLFVWILSGYIFFFYMLIT